jgi:2'-5' RNA ligase
MNYLFIAFPLDKIIGNQLERLCYGLPYVSWIEHNNFYLILANLGPADGALQLDIQEALAKIRFPPFNLYLNGVNYFIQNKTNGIIYSCVAPSEELSLFYKLLNKELLEILPKLDLKTIPPYVPLGRCEKIDERRLLDYLDANSYFTSQAFKNNSFLLLKNQHTLFNEVARFNFG